MQRICPYLVVLSILFSSLVSAQDAVEPLATYSVMATVRSPTTVLTALPTSVVMAVAQACVTMPKARCTINKTFYKKIIKA